MRAARVMKPKASLKSLKVNFLLMASRPSTSLQPSSLASAVLRAAPVNFSAMPRSLAIDLLQLTSCRLAQRRHFARARGIARAGLGRIIRRVLLAAQRLARELDEMVRDEAHAQHGIDLSAAKRVARRSPERLAVIGQEA